MSGNIEGTLKEIGEYKKQAEYKKIWTCKIGEIFHKELPKASDTPMRTAIRKAYLELTGSEPDFIFSGWGGELTEGEREVQNKYGKHDGGYTYKLKEGEEVIRPEGFVICNKYFPFGNGYMICTYTPSGDYIGSVQDAERLITKRGIRPEKRLPEHNVCSIGYQPQEKKWYGWSHRAIYGFGIGDTVKKGDCTSEYLPVGFTAKTMADAKRMAEAFAESVS